MNNECGRSKLTATAKQSLLNDLELRRTLKTKELARKYGVSEYLVDVLSARLNVERRAREHNDGVERQLQLF